MAKFLQSAILATSCGGPLSYHRFWAFFGLFACSARFCKNGDFLAAQPPERSFVRPVRWYLRYLRAQDAQSATPSLVYVTCGGSNLPARPKKRPRVPAGRIASRGVFVPGARFLASGGILQTYGHAPHGRFFDSIKIPSHTAIRPPKQQICQKKAKKIARRNRTNDHQTATTDNHGQ